MLMQLTRVLVAATGSPRGLTFAFLWLMPLGVISAAAPAARISDPVYFAADGGPVETGPDRRPLRYPYPRALQEKALDGYAMFTAWVRPDGTVQRSASFTNRSTWQPDKQLVEHWQPAPPLRDGRPVEAFCWRMIQFRTPPKDPRNHGPIIDHLTPIFLGFDRLRRLGYNTAEFVQRLRVEVDPHGAVRSVALLGSIRARSADGKRRPETEIPLDDDLRAEFLNIARQWRFLPAVKDGQPVDGSMRVVTLVLPQPFEAHPPEAIDFLSPRIPFRFPSWPHKARTKQPGKVVVEFFLDPIGCTRDLRVVESTDAALNDAALATVERWRFEHPSRDGISAGTRLRVIIPFHPKRRYLMPVNPFAAVIPPLWVKEAPIAYPAALLGTNFRAAVEVEVEIDAQGNPQNPVVTRSTNPLFNDVALERALKSTFAPGLVNGQPAAVRCYMLTFFGVESEPDTGDDIFSVSQRNKSAPPPPGYDYAVPPEPMGVTFPVYPYELLRDRIAGKARIWIAINRRGQVTDIKVIDADRPEFGDALVASAYPFRFRPAFTSNHVPTKSALTMEHRFNPHDVPSDLIWLLNRLEQDPAQLATADKLDEPLTPLSRRAPVLPLALRAPNLTGKAMVEVVIDPSGIARLPRIVSTTDPSFGFAAVQAVSEWRFAPPKVKGKAVSVRVRIPFRFGATPAPDAREIPGPVVATPTSE